MEIHHDAVGNIHNPYLGYGNPRYHQAICQTANKYGRNFSPNVLIIQLKAHRRQIHFEYCTKS